MLVVPPPGKDLQDVQDSAVAHEHRLSPSTDYQLLFVSNSRDLAHLRKKDRSCCIRIRHHGLFYLDPQPKSNYGEVNGIKIAPFVAILIICLQRWQRVSCKDSVTALTRGLQLARLIEDAHNICMTGGRPLVTVGFKMFDELRIYVYQLYQIVRDIGLVQRLLDLKLIEELHTEVFLQAPPIKTPRDAFNDSCFEWALVVADPKKFLTKRGVNLPQNQQSNLSLTLPTSYSPELDEASTNSSAVAGEAALRVKAILEDDCYEVAIFGSVASWVYGAKRLPKVSISTCRDSIAQNFCCPLPGC
jgi:hypothetical protein